MAGNCTITLKSESTLTVSDIELDGMEDVTVQSKGSKIYEITGYVKKNAENVALTIGINTYLYSMQIGPLPQALQQHQQHFLLISLASLKQGRQFQQSGTMIIQFQIIRQLSNQAMEHILIQMVMCYM